MSALQSLRPVVAVIGTTGVGKSNLAIALAESLKPPYNEGVVLSADSMQIYKGLDVITNKITREEMKGVRHWGLDLVSPGEGNWEMGRWCSEAEREVSQNLSLSQADDRYQIYQTRHYPSYVEEHIISFSISYSHQLNCRSRENQNHQEQDGHPHTQDQRWR